MLKYKSHGHDTLIILTLCFTIIFSFVFVVYVNIMGEVTYSTLKKCGRIVYFISFLSFSIRNCILFCNRKSPKETKVEG